MSDKRVVGEKILYLAAILLAVAAAAAGVLGAAVFASAYDGVIPGVRPGLSLVKRSEVLPQCAAIDAEAVDFPEETEPSVDDPVSDAEAPDRTPDDTSAETEAVPPADNPPPQGSGSGAVIPILDPGLIGQLDEGDVALPVPESEAVGDDYFADAIFLGNSRTQGLILYNALVLPTSYAYQGLNVRGFFTMPYVETASGTITVASAIAANPDFSKAYIMFGTNELGWSSVDVFIQYYSEVIDVVLEANPDALIYIQSILPVSSSRDATDPTFNNTNVVKFNARLRELAKLRGAYYLDVGSALADETGALPNEAASDGLHLKSKWCKVWYEYLKTHTVDPENPPFAEEEPDETAPDDTAEGEVTEGEVTADETEASDTAEGEGDTAAELPEQTEPTDETDADATESAEVTAESADTSEESTDTSDGETAVTEAETVGDDTATDISAEMMS